jgi:hypothetical protein
MASLMIDNAITKETSAETVNSAAPTAAAAPKPEPAKGDTFCQLPFHHLCVGTEGTARICCVTSAFVSEDGAPMSLYTRSFQEIWNSAYMREVRRKMLNGERLSQCEPCYKHEAATATSQRTYANSLVLADKPFEPDRLRRANYHVEGIPGYIKLELGNLCNLKCRMCCPESSSEVERDPVHSRWTGAPDPLHAIWDNDEALIGPGPRIGVARRGVYDLERAGNEWVNWTNGLAQFDLPLTAKIGLDRLIIRLSSNIPLDRFCVVSVNGQIGFQGCVFPTASDISIDLKNLLPSDGLKIDVMSTTVFNSRLQRDEGLPLISMTLHRAESPRSNNVKQPLRSRLGKPGLWYKDDNLLFGELLADVENLRQLCLAGAEPQLEPRYAEVIDYLIKCSVSHNIHLEIITNATIINKSLLENFKKFKSVDMVVSLDGVGPVLEYIRYPARWPVVQKNIRALKEEYGFDVLLSPTVQAYNILFLADIYYAAREIGVRVSCANVLDTPEWLRPSVMPRSVHRLAALRLREYLAVAARDESSDEALDWQHQQLLNLINHFESFESPLDEAALRTFNTFTTDLDVSRGQSFRDSLPELYDLIIESGYKWTDDVVYAHGRQPRQTARQRLHAWV